MANLKRHTIELVSEVNGDEVVTVIYATPAFVSTQTTYEAMDIGEKMDKQAKYERALQDGKTVEELGEEPATNKELFDTLVDFVVKLYDKQFTKKELLAGLHILVLSLFCNSTLRSL